MIKHVVRSVAGAAWLLSAAACAQECVPLKASSLSDVYDQLGAVRDEAYIDYFMGQPEKSVGSLTKVTETYARAQCTAVVPEELRAAFQYDELLERGRLARVYQKLDDEGKASSETGRAVALGRVVFRNAAWSAGDLFQLIARLDAQTGEEVRAAMSRKPPERQR